MLASRSTSGNQGLQDICRYFAEQYYSSFCSLSAIVGLMFLGNHFEQFHYQQRLRTAGCVG